MIIPHHFSNPTITIYDPKGAVVCVTNSEYTLLDIMLQIKQQHLSGYYTYFKKERIEFSPNGRIEFQPIGFFDTIERLSYKLMFE